jgi:hypothetical protein
MNKKLLQRKSLKRKKGQHLTVAKVIERSFLLIRVNNLPVYDSL